MEEEHFTLLTPITHVFHEMFISMNSRYNQLRGYNSRGSMARAFGSLSLREATRQRGDRLRGLAAQGYQIGYIGPVSINNTLAQNRF